MSNKQKSMAEPMIPPAAQAVAASGSSSGAPLFVAADLDLVAKTGVMPRGAGILAGVAWSAAPAP